MRRRLLQLLLAAAFALPAADGQVELRAVVGGAEQPVASVFDMGAVYPGETVTATFRLRNTSATVEATVAHLEVAGDGFELSAPPRPITLQPRAAVDFTIRFRSTRAGTYSAPLVGDGVSVFLVASVSPWLTYRVDSGAGFQPLSGAVDFGDVQRGQAVLRTFSVQNQMSVPLAIPALTVSGPGFALTGSSPSGIVLQPSETASFEVTFRAGYEVSAGDRTGVLAIGDRAYELRAAVVDPPPAILRLTVDLPQPGSARQGRVTLTADEARPYAIEGTLALQFQALPAGAADPAVCFSNGERTARFKIAPGAADAQFDGRAGMAFQTGSTAGTLTFSAAGGVSVESRSIVIAPAAVAFTSARAARTPAGIEAVITGFDNTRTAGVVSFTFFDAAGNVVTPGAILTDASAAFRSYFQAPSAGGAFSLKAVFPVTGDAAAIAGFEAAVENASGKTVTSRTSF